MKAPKKPWLPGLFCVVACTSTVDRPESAERDSISQVIEPSVPVPPPRCNQAIADAENAIRLAEDARRAAGFADHVPSEHERHLDEGFRLSPMVPLAWPLVNCAVVFYVYSGTLPVVGDARGNRGPVVARITVKLDDGAVETKLFHERELMALSGGLPRFGSGSLDSEFQQPVFEAVIGAAVPHLSEALAAYRSWLQEERYMAAVLYIWHREFFDAVVGDDEALRQDVEYEAAIWRRERGEE
ncbi:hypothetical protein [Enhygromyxa salina]|nr:hypothetical protein [Enhygromyxa salina]